MTFLNIKINFNKYLKINNKKIYIYIYKLIENNYLKII